MSALDEYNERRRRERERKQRRTRVVKRARKRAGIDPEAIAAKITGKPCRVCGSGYRVEAHHLVPRGVWPKSRDGLHSADNLIPLCNLHHQAHHTTAHGRVERHRLTLEERALVLDVKGEAWADLWYSDTIGRTA